MSTKMLVICIGEADRCDEVPLYEAIARKLIQLKAPGATVHRGIMGFGSHQRRLHHQQLFGFSDDRPITISVVHDEKALRENIIPVIRAMVRHGLMFLSDVELILHATPGSPASKSDDAKLESCLPPVTEP